MDFYSMLSRYYDEVFPLSSGAVNFINNRVSPGMKLLDAGCGTGELVHTLRKRGIDASGFDLDEAMIDQALKGLDPLDGADPEGIFKPGNLCDLSSLYEGEAFDSICCLGNTLIHIPFNLQFQFLQDSAALLKPGSLLVLQILNYANILDEGLKFPLLETEHCFFRRRYAASGNEGELNFMTELEVKESGEIFRNSISHYPLMPETLMAALSMAGFAEWQTYGSYSEESAVSGQLPLIIEARVG